MLKVVDCLYLAAEDLMWRGVIATLDLTDREGDTGRC